MRKLMGIAAGLAIVASAQAQVWTEVGDAPDLTGQPTIGTGPLTGIVGGLSASGDVDMYCITVTDPVTFGAVVATAGFDSQIWMFDLGGMGMNHNDDNVGLFSGIYVGGPAAGTPAPIPVVAGGIYGLAISAYDNDALAGGGPMWTDTPFGDQTSPELIPGPLAAWTGGGGSGTYDIRLTGASYWVPEPASLSLLALGGLLLARRR